MIRILITSGAENTKALPVVAPSFSLDSKNEDLLSRRITGFKES